MSTGLNCEFVQTTATEWFYVLEHGDAPKNAWDWREHATAYGPFRSEDEADQHLDRNHANPGGATHRALAPGEQEAQLDETLKQLIEQARKRPREEARSRLGGMRWR